MAINTHLSIIESKNQNKQAEQKQSHRHRKYFDGCLGGMGKKGEGNKKYKFIVTESSGGCKVQHRECRQ